MKIALITDTKQSAIWRLAQALKYDGIEYKTTSFHPKQPNPDEQKAVTSLFQWADLVHIQYWKSGKKIREIFPALWKSKRKILTHYNPYNLHEESWEDYVQVVVVNKTQHKELPQAKLIPLCTDIQFFTPVPKSTENIINMVVNRIEGKKGVQEVAKACQQLGYKFLLVGRVSDRNYLNQLLGSHVEFHESVTEDQLLHYYHRSNIHICNSVPNFESGTLPILEAMSCGVPVITRKVGHVPDIYDGNNMVLLEKPSPADVNEIKEAIRKVMENNELHQQLREAGLKTVQGRGYHIWRKMHADLHKGIK
jgi:glycosyltransferase involved in cell wall biosynthesis